MQELILSLVNIYFLTNQASIKDNFFIYHILLIFIFFLFVTRLEII